MPLLFLDTSALVKQYHEEDGSDVVKNLFDSSENIFIIASITLAEFASTFIRKFNEGIISEEDVHACLSEFSNDIRVRFLIIDLERSHISKGVSLILKHNLRTLDSLQLAVFLNLATFNPAMVTSDRILGEAATKEGFRVIVP